MVALTTVRNLRFLSELSESVELFFLCVLLSLSDFPCKVIIGMENCYYGL